MKVEIILLHKTFIFQKSSAEVVDLNVFCFFKHLNGFLIRQVCFWHYTRMYCISACKTGARNYILRTTLNLLQ